MGRYLYIVSLVWNCNDNDSESEVSIENRNSRNVSVGKDLLETHILGIPLKRQVMFQ